MSNAVETYYSQGKFLITGEYLVMAGAEAIVLPINKGQYLKIFEAEDENLHWQSFYKEQAWFEAIFDPESFEILKTSDQQSTAYITSLLKNAAQLSNKRKTLRNISIRTELEFDKEWGMGSSSTLLVNLSYLFDINAFDLHSKVSHGSGFDVAAALSDFPVRYRIRKNNREILPVHMPELFFDHTYFIYLGEKADSGIAVEDFHSRNKDLKMPVKYINEITAQFTELEDVQELSNITGEHEEFMGKVLCLESPTNHFPDYSYGMKSLGAWGGDFIMAVNPNGKEEVEQYFKHKGYTLIFSANELRVR